MQFFLIKHSNNFFSIKFFLYICQRYKRHSISYFFKCKTFFRIIWSVIVSKNVFFILISLHGDQLQVYNPPDYFIYQSQYLCLHLYDLLSTGFVLIGLWYVLLYLLTISSNLSIYTFCDMEDIKILWYFMVLKNQSAATYFSYYVLNACLYHYLATMISLSYCRIWPDSSNIF